MNAAASPAVLLAAARRSQRGLCQQGHGWRDSTLADKRLPQLPRVSRFTAPAPAAGSRGRSRRGLPERIDRSRGNSATRVQYGLPYWLDFRLL